MRPLVIYHANCLDGFGAAFAAWLKLGDEAEYLPMQYGKFPEVQDLRDMVDGREVYVLDFSLPKPGMNELFRSAKRVVWFDHHASVFKDWDVSIERPAYGLDVLNETTSPHFILLDNNKSGAMIAWEYFHPKTEVPMLIKHIDDYDRWQFKLEGTKEFNKALWSYAPWSFEQWTNFTPNEDLPHYTEARYTQMLVEGAAILRAHEQNVRSVVNGASRPCTILKQIRPRMYVELQGDALWIYNQDPSYADASVTGLAANCPPHLTSDVGHELATTSGTFGLCWCVGTKTPFTANCSLRSNGDYDVSAIAKAFGGGGHKNAAGFEVPLDTLLSWIK